MILILHAFSRRNAGDGLLVDLTLEAVEAAGIDRKECTVLALDPESFLDLDNVECAPGEPRAVPSLKVVRAAMELAVGSLANGEIDRLVSKARGLVAVGGGYLVADSPVRQVGVMLNHYAQLRAAARAKAPAVYLPQSIGPLHSPVAAPITRRLRQLDRLYLRDDRSMREFGGENVRRCADLAVMKLARTMPETAARGAGTPVVVARELPDPGAYEASLSRLADALGDPRWAVQADVDGPRSDRAFYARLGVADVGPLGHLLGSAPPPVVVSVRLHGAIAALLAGVPAIHLAYERKGFGAYQDLQLGDFVHDARTFDPDAVARQAVMLQFEPEAMWTQLRSSQLELQRQYAGMVEDLRGLLQT